MITPYSETLIAWFGSFCHSTSFSRRVLFFRSFSTWSWRSRGRWCSPRPWWSLCRPAIAGTSSRGSTRCASDDPQRRWTWCCRRSGRRWAAGTRCSAWQTAPRSRRRSAACPPWPWTSGRPAGCCSWCRGSTPCGRAGSCTWCHSS